MWQITRHQIIKDNYLDMKINDIVAIEHDWCPVFVVIPRRTIGRQWVWFKKVYCRRVWVYTGFVDEPETQYGTIFDVLGTANAVQS